jgi:UDP-N-acetylmuramoylalanine--D-glutamate ligase
MKHLGKNYTILGLSKTGISAAQYLQTQGAQCFLSESLPASPLNEAERQRLTAMGVVIEMGGHSRRCFTHADTVIISPGVPPSATLIKELTLSGKMLLSDVEIAWQDTQNTPQPVKWVGITGTNGKTTTTSLVSAILTKAGHYAPACGNIGLPFLTVLQERTPDTWVAELSSYQLDRTHNFKVTVGVFLNLTPDHLDWHGSLDAYQNAKLGFITGERSPEVLVYRAADPLASRLSEQNRSPRRYPFSLDPAEVQNAPYAVTLIDAKTIVLKTPQALIPVLNIDELGIIGPHNIENVMASVATAHALDIPIPLVAEVCKAFTGVPHRLEYVATVNGCPVYNDSKATNPEATLSALNSFAADQPVVLLVGGKDKNGPLTDFVAKVNQQASAVVLFGQAADRFEQALQASGYSAIHQVNDLAELVAKGLALAVEGQPVVFSPACASFDMFKNFEDRGDQFKALVKSYLAAVPVSHVSSTPPTV